MLTLIIVMLLLMALLLSIIASALVTLLFLISSKNGLIDKKILPWQNEKVKIVEPDLTPEDIEKILNQ